MVMLSYTSHFDEQLVVLLTVINAVALSQIERTDTASSMLLCFKKPLHGKDQP